MLIANPLALHDAPDPFMTFDSQTGYYYALFTLHDRLEIFRSRHAATILTDRDTKVIFRASSELKLESCIWAPEMHKGSDGKWYIYSSGQETKEFGPKRLFVLKALTEDPFGEWEYLGKFLPDLWAIDTTSYLAPNNIQYISFCHIHHDEYGNTHNIIQIRRMLSPWLPSDQYADISHAEYEWELVPPYDITHTINEGPFFISHNERLFLVYSANGMTVDQYCMGLLEFLGDQNNPDQMCSAEYWKKYDTPVFRQGNGVYGPGHASFFRSPDGTELWCAYHGMDTPSTKSQHRTRYMHIQKIDFDENNFPVMGQPSGHDVRLLPPSGEADD